MVHRRASSYENLNEIERERSMINRNNRRVALMLTLTTLLFLPVSGQQQKPDSGMSQHQMNEMNKRGDKHMGFDHLKTPHHFLLANDGGSIQVEANDLKDTESRDQIRRPSTAHRHDVQ